MAYEFGFGAVEKWAFMSLVDYEWHCPRIERHKVEQGSPALFANAANERERERERERDGKLLLRLLQTGHFRRG